MIVSSVVSIRLYMHIPFLLKSALCPQVNTYYKDVKR
nr:MAG TPA: hypothetical protein [Caudoviricetes sp.]